MITRTDIHRPAAIVAADYDFVAFSYLGGGESLGLGELLALQVERERLRAHMDHTGGRHTTHEHGGTCGICGANASYVSIFHHRPSNEYLTVGWECAEKLEMAQDAAHANLFRTAIREARELQTGKRKAQALLSDYGCAAAWDVYLSKYVMGESRDIEIVRDIVRKLVRYGSLSDKQVAFLRTLLDRIARQPEIDAQRAAERAAAADCPTGRVTFTGTVLKVKWVDGYMRNSADVAKLVIKTVEGWLVYVTAPGALLDWQMAQQRAEDGSMTGLKGLTVTMAATVTPSKDDPKFGFGKRPMFINAQEG